jgi:hypothetical protein
MKRDVSQRIMSNNISRENLEETPMHMPPSPARNITFGRDIISREKAHFPHVHGNCPAAHVNASFDHNHKIHTLVPKDQQLKYYQSRASADHSPPDPIILVNSTTRDLNKKKLANILEASPPRETNVKVFCAENYRNIDHTYAHHGIINMPSKNNAKINSNMAKK